MENIQVKTKVPDSFNMTNSDVMYGDTPNVKVRCQQKEATHESPRMALRFDQRGQQKTISFHLPIMINSYCDAADMSRDKFETVWADITNNRPDSFQKVDVILKSPAPPHVSVQNVLTQMASLLNKCFGLKVLAPEGSAYTKIQAVGQTHTCKENVQGYPNPSEQPGYVVPIMVEIAFYPDIGTDEFRLSLRSTDKK